MLSSLVLQDPSEGLVQLLIVILQIGLTQWHIQEQLVERLDKVALEQLLIHQSLAYKLSNKVK